MRHIFTLFTLLIAANLYAQNVGIGTTAPAEKLDVNGNVNITGTIKANGTVGQAGQVLRTSNTGVLEWGSTCQFSNFMAFNISGAGNWTIPVGVTKILVEAWGGGGGGSQTGGGGGGGYAKAHFIVATGTNISVIVGAGGAGGTSTASSGQQTTISLTDAQSVTYTIFASGGLGAYTIGNTVKNAFGGSYGINPGYEYFTGAQGHSGRSTTFNFMQSSSTEFTQSTYFGNGGDGGNSINTGGIGGNGIVSGGQVLLLTESADGLEKGGGGSGMTTFTNASTTGTNGGRGKVIIWY